MAKIESVLLQNEHQNSAGIKSQELDKQVERIKNGTNYVKLLRPCTVGDGILRLSKNQIDIAIEAYNKHSSSVSIEKFIPASGAATRMFKGIYNWIDTPKKFETEINRFFQAVEKFAAFEEWLLEADRLDVSTFEAGLESQVEWLKLLVNQEALGFAHRPKGLIPFHQYHENTRTPVLEHLVEATRYALNGEKCNLHFTVSEEHLEGFEAELEQIERYGELKGFDFGVNFSFQSATTDTVATDTAFNILYENGKPLMRPGGHGALIHNLNALKSDLIFIKNIDNVCHQSRIETTVKYKKVLAGILFQLREDLKTIDKHLKRGLLDEIEIQQLRDKWDIRIPKSYRELKAFLKRPIRVCGMVQNEGEPGGGPFWVMDANLGESVQIVEQSQINTADSAQNQTLKHSTHFNPVDLACYLKDLDDNPIDLTKYVDEQLYFVASKSHKGREIKALEWPGLWNGAMANWITIFVEVPISTFNPVKEFRDLLRTSHLPE